MLGGLRRILNSDLELDSPLVALTVHRRLDEIERESKESRLGFQETHDEFRRTLADLGREVHQVRGIADEVKRLQGETNSRVAKLELARARLEGARSAMSWVPMVVCPTISGIVVAAAAILLGGV